MPGFDANFTAAYLQFVVNLTTVIYYPTLPIFAVVGPMVTTYNSSLSAAVQQAQALGINVTMISLAGALDCYQCVGCSGHPGRAGMQAMFELSQPTISRVMGWA
jgi:hypothetical protein